MDGIALDFFEQALLMQSFVDTDATNFFMINIWETAQSSEKIFEKFAGNFFSPVKEMDVKISTLSGATRIRFSDLKLLDRFTKV